MGKKSKKKKKDKKGTDQDENQDMGMKEFMTGVSSSELEVFQSTQKSEKKPKLKTNVKKMTKEEKKMFKLGYDVIDYDAENDVEDNDGVDDANPHDVLLLQDESKVSEVEKKPKLKTDVKKMTKEEKKMF